MNYKQYTMVMQGDKVLYNDRDEEQRHGIVMEQQGNARYVHLRGARYRVKEVTFESLRNMSNPAGDVIKVIHV